MTRTAAGNPRRLGVELEFSGLAIESIAMLVQRTLGGDIEPLSDYEIRVGDTRLGEFLIELDFRYLKTLARDQASAETDRDELDLARLPAELLGAVARHVVPMEIVSPPMELARAGELAPLVAALRDAGARGTRHSPLYAFGLHLNPEAPATDGDTLLRYLQAYLCLHEWLVRANEVDWSRRVTPYINPFPKTYVTRVVQPDYRPAMAQLIDDYLADNPQRNRALDMLPLFADIDEQRVRAVIDDPRIKPRPAFHYRLPNCDIDLPGWGIQVPWRHWLQVEHLACDRERLARMGAAYAEHLATPLGALTSNWAETSERWLHPARDL